MDIPPCGQKYCDINPNYKHSHFPGFLHNWGMRREITDEFLDKLEEACGPDPMFGTAKCVWAVSYADGLSLIEEVRRLRKLLDERKTVSG